MKTKFLFFISIFFIVTMFIYYNLHQYINNYDVVLVDNLESFETKEIKLCLLNEKNEFEILDINIPNNIKEEEYIIKLLDDYRNSLIFKKVFQGLPIFLDRLEPDASLFRFPFIDEVFFPNHLG